MLPKKILLFVLLVVTIDLLDLALNPDSKRSTRVRWALGEKQPLKFDFLLAWHHAGEPGRAPVAPADLCMLGSLRGFRGRGDMKE